MTDIPIIEAEIEPIEPDTALYLCNRKACENCAYPLCKPTDIETELRIYQSDDILCHNPTADDISAIMNKIIVSDKIIKKIKERES